MQNGTGFCPGLLGIVIVSHCLLYFDDRNCSFLLDLMRNTSDQAKNQLIFFQDTFILKKSISTLNQNSFLNRYLVDIILNVVDVLDEF